jgi:hypothetical protein
VASRLRGRCPQCGRVLTGKAVRQSPSGPAATAAWVDLVPHLRTPGARVREECLPRGGRRVVPALPPPPGG